MYPALKSARLQNWRRPWRAGDQRGEDDGRETDTEGMYAADAAESSRAADPGIERAGPAASTGLWGYHQAFEGVVPLVPNCSHGNIPSVQKDGSRHN